ncbi:MAG: hypothetical protein ACREEM_46120 [Blastocatellia bacterium]
MRRQETILIIVLTLLLSATGAFAAYPQMELPPEKKKALRKFDPADIFPEVRGSEESQDRKKSKQNPGRPGLTRSAAPPATPAESGSRPGEGLERRGRTSTALPAPTQPIIQELQPSEPLLAGSREPAVTFNRSVQATGLPLHFTFMLLGLIFLTLFAVAIKLKKDLRKH